MAKKHMLGLDQKWLFLIAGLLAGILIAVIAFPKASSSETTTYVDELNGFSIDVPSGTNIVAGPESRDNFVVFTIGNSTLGVSSFEGNLAENTVDDLKKAYAENLPAYNIILDRHELVGDKEIYDLAYSWERGGIMIAQRQVILAEQGQVFVLTFTTPLEIYGSEKVIFENALRTFREI